MYFKDIIGQNDLKLRLIQSISEGIIPHAQLFAGKAGVGALPLALASARYLHCASRQADDACGQCPSCLKIDKLSHPDLHFVFPIVNKKGNKDAFCDDFLPEWRAFVRETPYGAFSDWLGRIAAENANAQGLIYARESDEILRKLSLRASESEYRILIIWLPEKMHEAAANKLLKLLEEPPEKTVFFLVAEDPEKIIATVRSRAQTLQISPIPDADLAQALREKYHPADEDLPLIVRLAKGSYAEAVQIISTAGENEACLELFAGIMRNSWTRNIVNMKLQAEQFAALGRDRQKAFFTYAQRMIRENFLYRLQTPEINYLNRKEQAFSANFFPYVNEANIVDFMDELSLAERHVEANVNARMVFFDLSMKIALLLKKQ